MLLCFAITLRAIFCEFENRATPTRYPALSHLSIIQQHATNLRICAQCSQSGRILRRMVQQAWLVCVEVEDAQKVGGVFLSGIKYVLRFEFYASTFTTPLLRIIKMQNDHTDIVIASLLQSLSTQVLCNLVGFVSCSPQQHHLSRYFFTCHHL